MSTRKTLKQDIILCSFIATSKARTSYYKGIMVCPFFGGFTVICYLEHSNYYFQYLFYLKKLIATLDETNAEGMYIERDTLTTSYWHEFIFIHTEII